MRNIIWHQLPDESPENRIDRLNNQIHHIFFDGKVTCTEDTVLRDAESTDCTLCRAHSGYGETFEHCTPPFLESLDAMQLVIESGKFAEVRKEFFHWVYKDRYECTIMLYRQIGDGIYFRNKGNTHQEAFYLTALQAMGYNIITEE